MDIGLPYAEAGVEDDGRYYVTCPVCSHKFYSAPGSVTEDEITKSPVRLYALHYEGMHDEADLAARAAAREIADEVIEAARNSGSDPIVWVTGNNYMPPLRSFAAAEKIYQTDRTGDVFAFLVEQLEQLLAEADVFMECPDWDNAYYAVDRRRFEYVEDSDGENLQDDWKPVCPEHTDDSQEPLNEQHHAPEDHVGEGSCRCTAYAAREDGHSRLW
jgi:hypothetical protein